MAKTKYPCVKKSGLSLTPHAENDHSTRLIPCGDIVPLWLCREPLSTPTIRVYRWRWIE